MTRTERIVLGVLIVMLLSSFAMLLRLYYVQHSDIVARSGGTYIEGAVGELVPLSPWFVTGNDVNRDIASLLFSGLMRYNPKTGTIDNDLATVTASKDNKIYTATLKEGLLWHDSTAEDPHPVTSDDILFTFQTIQDPAFENPLLKQNFRGVTIEKVDDRTVRFILEKPYVFFPSNLTLGLVPKASFAGIAVDKLRDALIDFGLHPIGAGRFAFQGILQTDRSTEVTLRRFIQPGQSEGHIERIIIRVFPDYTTLLSDIGNMDGVRLAARSDDGTPILPKHFHAHPYTLPQYVGLFFNLDRPIPADRNVRIGLQRGMNKQALVDAIHETEVIDTPLLELASGDWRYTFDANAAKGAFFDSDWNLPEKVRLQRLLEEREANQIGALRNVQRVVFLGTGAQLVLTGSTKDLHFPLTVNGILVSTGATLGKNLTHTGAWIVQIPAGNGMSGSLAPGMNVIKMMDVKGDLIDSAYLVRYVRMEEYRRAAEEQRIVEAFLASKEASTHDLEPTTIDSLAIENGFLRKRKPSDPTSIRVNAQGKELSLTLLTSPVPEHYAHIATELQKQWEQLGARVSIVVPDTKQEFEERLLRREYDVILFGQSLLDNLDSYPYWHSSQIQERSDPNKLRLDALNLSQYASFDVDLLLSTIREVSDDKRRKSALQKLQEHLKNDVPAIMLYSPLYVTAVNDRKVHGVQIGSLALHADRLRGIDDWYVTTGRTFKDGMGWSGFPAWLLRW